MKYLIVVEKTETGFSAYSPDVPGCVSTGRTEEETEANMKEAIEFHVDGLKQEGLPVYTSTIHEIGICGDHCPENPPQSPFGKGGSAIAQGDFWQSAGVRTYGFSINRPTN